MLGWSASDYTDSTSSEPAPISANPLPCQMRPRSSSVAVNLSIDIVDSSYCASVLRRCLVSVHERFGEVMILNEGHLL